ncbi:MAG: DUF503 domain-containing protein [Halanaerobiales bacterium]|nr:DUF503 domain-containing protein [Halanaerobiales bacterium]
MFVAVIKIELQIPMARSLKDKRSIIKSMIEKSKNKFNIAVAEVDDKDLWKNSTIGIVTVADNKYYLDKVVNKVINFVENFPEVYLYNFEITYY